MLPLGCDNLLVAGKTISAESAAAGAIRVMPCCLAMGQAAGAAAAICVREGVEPADADIKEIQAVLREHGGIVE